MRSQIKSFKANLFNLLLVIPVIFLTAAGANAVTRTWDGGGADDLWSTAANWSGDAAPAAADDVVFNATSTKNATVDAALTVNSVTVNAGYTGTITQAAALTVTNAFTQSSGTFQGTAANATFGSLTLTSTAVFNAPSSTLTINSQSYAGLFDKAASAVFNANGGTVEAKSPVSYAPFGGAAPITLNNFTVSMGTSLPGALIVNGTLTIGSGAYLAGGAPLKANGDVVFANDADPVQGSTEIQFSDTATRTATITGARVSQPVTINNPNITVTTGAAAGETVTWYKKVVLQAGTLNQSAANYVFSANSGFNAPGFSVAGGTFQGSGGSAAFNTTIGISSGALNAGSGGMDVTAASCANIYYQQSGGAFHGGAGSVKLCDARTTGGVFTAPAGNLTILSYADLNAVTFHNNGGTLVIGNWVGVAAAGKTFNNVALQGANDHDLSGTPIPVVGGTLDLTSGTMNGGGQLAANGSIIYNANFRGGNKQIVFQDAATRTVNLPASIYLLPMLLDNPNITVTTSDASPSAIYAGNTEVRRGTFRQGAAELFVGPDNVGGAYDFKVSGGTFVGSGAPFTVRAGGGLVLTAGAFQGGTGLFTGNYINTQGGTFSTGGDATIGNYYQSGGIFNAPGGLMTVVADWTHISGGAFNAGTGSVKLTGYNVYNCANSYTSNVDVTETFYNLEIANSFCNARYIAAGDTLVVTNNLRLSYAKIGGGKLRPLGTVTIEATNTIDYAGSTVVEYVTPNANFVINNPASSVAMLPVEMNAGGATLTSSGAGKIIFYGMTLRDGTLNQPNAVWDFATYPGYTQSGGTFNGSAAQLNISNGAANGQALTGGAFNGGTGLISGGWSQSGGTFQTQGNMNVGQFTLSGGTFNAPAGTLDVFNGFTHTSGGTFNAGTGTVQTSVIPGVYGIAFDVNATETFYNLRFNGTYNSANHLIAAGDTLVVNGALNFNGRGVSGGSIVANGDVSHTNYGAYRGGTTLVKFEDAAARTVTLCGDAASCAGSPEFDTQPMLVNNPNITVNAGLNANGSMIVPALTLQQGTFNQGDGRVAMTTFNQSGGTYNGGTFSQAFGALNSFTYFTLTGGDFNAAPSMTVAGSFTHTTPTGNFNEGTGTVYFYSTFFGTSGSIDVDSNETFYNLAFYSGNGTLIAPGDTLTVSGTTTLRGGTLNGGTLDAKGDVIASPANVGGSFQGGTTNAVFSGTGTQTFTNLDGRATFGGTWTVNKPNSAPLAENGFAPAAPTTLLIGGAIGSAGLNSFPPLAVVSGNVVQTGNFSHALGSLSLAPGTSFVNEFGGTITLAGNLSNDGSLNLNGAGSACPQADAILIRSSSAAQRSWSGAGDYRLIDVDLQNQNSVGRVLNVYSGTDSGGNANFVFNGGCLAPTAANVSVTGRVVGVEGGIRGVRVVLTDAGGASRAAVTNQFGVYSFEDVAAGQTVIVSVSSKKYVFDVETRVLNVLETLSDVDFKAEER